MKENMILLESKSDATLVVSLPELNYYRTWTAKGMKLPMDKDMLEQAIYDPGFNYLLKTGMLFIHDMELKKDLGLEPVDATEPTNIIELTDALLSRMIKAMPIDELKKTMAKLSAPQKAELAEYAIEHNADLNMSKIDYLSEATGKNLLNAIKNAKAAEE